MGFLLVSFQSLPSFSSNSSSPWVAQPLTPSLSPSILADLLVSSPASLSSTHEPQPLPSQPPTAPISFPKSKLVPIPSVHPMLTRSKPKQLVTSLPHALVSTLEPSSVHEALSDSRWAQAMEEEFQPCSIITLEILFHFIRIWTLLVANGYFGPSITLMALFLNTRLG